DSELSPKGQCYSAVLSRFIAEKSKQDPYFQLSIWTSSLKRTIQTAESIKEYPKVSWKALDEIDAGIFDGMTYKEIEREYPNEWQARQMDKFNYRYPRGEVFFIFHSLIIKSHIKI